MIENIIASRYKEGAFKPLSPLAIKDKFTEGELYFIRVDRKRYKPRHDWFMALIRENWETLTDSQRNAFSNPDILRKRLLIAAGYRDTVSYVMQDEATARKFAADMASRLREFTIVSVNDNVVLLITAKSQAYDAMDNKTFTESCDKCLNELAILLSVDKKTLTDRGKELQSVKHNRKTKSTIQEVL